MPTEEKIIRKMVKLIETNLIGAENTFLLSLLVKEYLFNKSAYEVILYIKNKRPLKISNRIFHSGIDMTSKVCEFITNNLLSEDSTIIDCGCGSGIISLLVSEYVSRVIAFDINEEAVEIAKQNLKNVKNVKVIKHDFRNIQKINDEDFTAVIFNAPFYVVRNSFPISREMQGWLISESDIPKFFRFCIKNLKKGGHIYLILSLLGSYKIYLSYIFSLKKIMFSNCWVFWDRISYNGKIIIEPIILIDILLTEK